MALDIGTKRIGIALGDEMQLIAQPFIVIERKKDNYVLNTIKKIVSDYQVNEIVVGIPFYSHYKIGKMAEMILDFVEKLKMFINVPIILWDESLTTIEAEKFLIESDISRKRRKKVIDKLAAALILDSFLKARDEKK